MVTSFDFDHTLSFNDNSLNEKTATMFRECMQNGDLIYIITSRYWSQLSEDYIQDFLDTHGLKVSGIYHCSGPKDDMIKKLKIEKHFDDDVIQLGCLKDLGIELVNCFDKEQYRKEYMHFYGDDPYDLDN